MLKNSRRPKWIKKAEAIGNSPIALRTALFKTVIDANISSERLYANEVFEVDIVLSGNGIFQIFGQAIPCKQCDVFVIPPDIPHNFFVSAPDEILNISQLFFDIRDWFDGEVSKAGTPHFCYGIFADSPVYAYAALNTKAYTDIKGAFDGISSEISAKEPQWQDAVRAELSLLLITLARYIGKAEHISLNVKDRRAAGVAVQMISENFSDSALTLEGLAENLYISKSQLSRLFNEVTGAPFSVYLRDLRLNHACGLLRETDKSIRQIVSECGMRDIRSFYKNFQKFTGKTPNQYRNEIKSKNETEEKIMVVLSDISEKLQQGRGKVVAELVKTALDEGCNPEKILSEGLLSGMDIIGEKFRNNEIFVPEVLVAARAMNMGAQILKPYLAKAGIANIGKVCLGTVQGDLHDIGKNLVKMMMEGKGIEVIDLGTDVPTETFIQTAINEHCDAICCSALLTTTMGVMGEVVKAAEAAGIRDKVKIMIGGAPVNEDFCKQIGADAYTPDAATAANVAYAFCKANREKEKQ